MNEDFNKKILCYETTAIAILGLTKSSFKKLNISPVKVVRNPHHKKTQAYLYDQIIIENMVDTPHVIALRSKLRKNKDYNTIFNEKYFSYKDAIEDAATAMYQLNKYTKNYLCPQLQKNNIYNLKNKFIKFLYENNFCVESYIHVQTLPKRFCKYCGGEGCDECDDTGVYLNSLQVEHYVFKFKINEQFFTWHLPKNCVNFSIKEANLSVSEMNDTKVSTIKPNKIKEKKLLIEWVLDRYFEAIHLGKK